MLHNQNSESFTHWRAALVPKKSVALDLTAERAELAREQKIAAQMKNAIAGGEHVSLKAILNALDTLFHIIREVVLGLPGKIADALSPYSPLDRTKIYEILYHECREMLIGLSSGALVEQALNQKTAAATADADDEAEATP